MILRAAMAVPPRAGPRWQAPGRRALLAAGLASVLLHLAAFGLLLAPPRGPAGPVALPPIEIELVDQAAQQRGAAPAAQPATPAAAAAPAPPPPAPAPPDPQPPSPEPLSPEPLRPEPPSPAPASPAPAFPTPASTAPPSPPLAARPPEPAPQPDRAAPSPSPSPSQAAPPPPAARPAESPAPPPPPSRPRAPQAVRLGGEEDRDPLRVSGRNVVPPHGERGNRPPAYPPEAARAGIEGDVGLLIHVAPSGQVAWVDLAQSSGNRWLDQTAIRAAQSWRFRPARNEAGPVPFELAMTIRFRLGENP